MCVSGWDFHKIRSHQEGTLVLIWGGEEGEEEEVNKEDGGKEWWEMKCGGLER